MFVSYVRAKIGIILESRKKKDVKITPLLSFSPPCPIDVWRWGKNAGWRHVKKSHVRFFHAEASQKNFSREIFSREGLPENFLT